MSLRGVHPDPASESIQSLPVLPGSLSGGDARPQVLVVGGGVSGCACAVSLAGQGVRVTVVSSALDSIGLPGYGANVIAAGGRAAIAEALAMIPPPLRDIWLDAAVTPDCESGVLAVDRRMISVETKCAMEQIPLLEFRQGLVTDLRLADDAGGGADGGGRGAVDAEVAVETAFGEVVEADAVVIAVGLGLGGTVHVGEDVLPGGRYGETGADGLRMALECMGAGLEEVRLEVGPRVGGQSATVAGSWNEKRGGDGVGRRLDGVSVDTDGSRLRSDTLVPEAGDSPGEVECLLSGAGELPCGAGEDGPMYSIERVRRLREVLQSTELLGGKGGVGRPVGCPTAPHWAEGLPAESMVMLIPREMEPTPVISPDGAATGELYVDPLGARGHELKGILVGGKVAGGESLIASRLDHCVTGKRITNLSPHGRLTLSSTAAPPDQAVPPDRAVPPVWVAGRAGGAGDYLESLRSGVRVAYDVRRWLKEIRE